MYGRCEFTSRSNNMSEFDRQRDPRQKKFFGMHNKDRRDHGTWGLRRMPIILTKPGRERDRDGDSEKDRLMDNRSPAKPLSQPTPTIILRNRDAENRPASQQSARPTTVLRKESESQPVYQLAGKHGHPESANPLALPPTMKAPVKLLDETLQLSDAALEFLVEQPDFVVVGLLGAQGVGKSTVASLLASGGDPTASLRKPLFRVHGQEQFEYGTHCTNGIDMLVTSGRMIILDSQPLLSASIMDKLILQEGKKFGPGPPGSTGGGGAPDFSSTENTVEVQSLQQAAFLLSVCHIVILVQDWAFDPNIVRFLQTAEMLKPSTPTTADDEIIEYFPHVLFLHNHCNPSDFGPRIVKILQDMYNKMFLRSRLQIQTGIGIATGEVLEYLNSSTCGEPINLFLLPDLTRELTSDENEDETTATSKLFSGHPGLGMLVNSLRNQLLGSDIQPLTHATLTEKNWFHYTAKIWELVKKSSFFLEYSRLLP
ncbi:hypothetical protein R5R35_001354 [Gryllus longicercus]|uniref:Protein SMG9 n=2 Tax=Gryllus longicercus TaxID=2509291 RepID=A0AAN9Z4E5_9ORTH